MPKPVYPVGSVAQQPHTSAANSAHHQPPQLLPSNMMHLPLASLIRAGVVTSLQGGAQSTQSVPLTHHSASSTSAPPQATQQASASSDDVVMIDLDELPSPTKPMQAPFSVSHLQPQANQPHMTNDLVMMARHAFPNVSPEFIGLLLNQGNAQGSQALNAHISQAPNAHGSQASSVRPQASTQVLDVEDDSREENVASEDKTPSNSTSTTENSNSLRTLLAKSPSCPETANLPTPPMVQDPAAREPLDVSSSPTPPIAQDVAMASDKPENPAQQETAEVQSVPTPPIVQDLTMASDHTDKETAEVQSLPTPPIVQDVPAQQETPAVRSSPTPPIVQDESAASDQPAQQKIPEVRSSPTPPIAQELTALDGPINPTTEETPDLSTLPTPPTVKELHSSPSPQGEACKESTS